MSMNLQTSVARPIPQQGALNNLDQNNKKNSYFNLFRFVKAAMILGAVGGLPVIRAVLDNEGSNGSHLRSNPSFQPELTLLPSFNETKNGDAKHNLQNNIVFQTLNPIEMVQLFGNSPNTVFTCSGTLSAKLDISSHSWPQYNSQPCIKFPTLPNTLFSSASVDLFVKNLFQGYGGPVSQMRVALYYESPNQISEQFTTWNTMHRTAKTHGPLIEELTPFANQWVTFDVSNFITPNKEFAVCLEVSTPENGAHIGCDSDYIPKLIINTASSPTPTLSPTTRTEAPSEGPSSNPSSSPSASPTISTPSPTVAPTNYVEPSLVSQIPNKLIHIGLTTVFEVSSSFAGVGLRFSAELESGESLPHFMQFSNGEFSIESHSGNQNVYAVKVTATDTQGVSISDVFEVEVPNRGVSITGSYDTQHIIAGESFDFIVSDIFNDPDGDALVYESRLGNDNPLPYWITFNPDTRRFIGTAPEAMIDENLVIKMTVTDPYGESKSDVFNLEINEKPEKKEDSFDWGLFAIVAPVVGFLSILIGILGYKYLRTPTEETASRNEDLESQIGDKPVAQAVSSTSSSIVYTNQVELIERRVEKNDGESLVVVPSAPPFEQKL